MATPTTPHAADAAAFESRTMRKVGLRLIPFLVLCYFIAYVDRVNVGFAALTMNEDLGISATAYGLGAGIFFLTYFVFEVPSNLILERVGARVWIAQVGRIPLLLLDSDIPENDHDMRNVTDRLYGGDTEHRLRQEILLGIGEPLIGRILSVDTTDMSFRTFKLRRDPANPVTYENRDRIIVQELEGLCAPGLSH